MFTNLLELIKSMPTEQDCRLYIANQRWENGKAVCPYCSCTKCYNIEGGKRYKCSSKTCAKKFSVTVGTVMEASNIPLSKWLAGIYLVSAHKKGISSHQLGRDLGIAQKNSWFMLHRIREMLGNVSEDLLQGTIEVDETYMGRKYRSDFVGLPESEVTEQMKGRHKGKGAVLGMAQRRGKVVIKVYNNIDSTTAQQAIKDSCIPGSTVYTDQSGLYRSGLDEFVRGSVRHTRPNPQWTKGDIHTNNIEGFWATMKRGIHGIYHQVSFKHLQAYCNEFSYRYNSRDIKDAARFTVTLQRLERRLTYKQLVHGKGSQKETEQNP